MPLVQTEHGGAVDSLTFSPDGRYLATRSQHGDRTLRIWDVEAKALVRLFRDPGTIDRDTLAERFRFAVPPKDVAKALSEGLVRVPGDGPTRWLRQSDGFWERLAKSGETLGRLDKPAELQGKVYPRLVFEDTGSALAAWTGRGKTLALWRLRGASRPRSPEVLRFERVVTDAVLFPGGHRVAIVLKNLSSTPPTVLVRDIASGKSTALPYDGGYIRDLSVSRDGQRLLAASQDGAYLWDTAKRVLLWRNERSVVVGKEMRGYRAARLSPDARWAVMTTSKGKIEVFFAGSGRLHGGLGARLRAPRAIVFADDDRLVVRSRDARPGGFETGRVTVWDLANARKHEASSLDVRGLVAVDAASSALLSLRSMAVVAPETGAGRCLRDGKTGARVVWERWSGITPPESLGEHDDYREAPSETDVPSICVRDFGEVNVLGLSAAANVVLVDEGDGGRLASYRLTDNRRVPLGGGWKGGHLGLSLGPGWQVSKLGRWIMYASGTPGSLWVWDAASGALRHDLTVRQQGHWGAEAFAVSPDEREIAVAAFGIIERYDLKSGKKLQRIDTGAWISALAYTRDKRMLVGTRDGSLSLVGPDGEQQKLGTVTGDAVTELRVNPSATRAAAVGADGTVRLWDLTGKALSASLLDFTDGEWLLATPSGPYTGTVEAAHRMRWIYTAPFEHFRFEQFASLYRDAGAVRAVLRGESPPGPSSIQRPPRLQVKNASEETATDTAEIQIDVASTTRVDVVRAYVEGRLVGERPVCARSARVDLSVPVQPGRSRVTLLAFDDRGRASNPRELDVRSTARSAKRPELWIVAVGVSRYPKLGRSWQLPAADDDARAIAEQFSKLAGEGKRYRRARVRLLLNEGVTIGSIRRALSELRDMKPEDTAVVFFAGHGIKPSAEGEMMFVTGAVSSLENLEGAAFGWEGIAAALGEAKGKVMVLLDACHAGHVNRELVVPNNQLASRLATRDRAGVFVLAAAKGREFSYETNASRSLVRHRVEAPESGVEADGHGLFTAALIDALQSDRTDLDGDRLIQLSELVEEVTRRVVTVSDGKQTPWVARREMLGDFALAPVRAEPIRGTAVAKQACRSPEKLPIGRPVSGTTRGGADAFQRPCRYGICEGQGAPDRLFRFDVPQRSRFRVRLGSDFYSVLSVRRVCGDEGSEVDWAMSDVIPLVADVLDLTPSNEAAQVVATLSAGTYYVLVDGYKNDHRDYVGDFQLIAEVAPVAGDGAQDDTCASAPEMRAGRTSMVDTFHARDDFQGSCGGGGAADVVRAISVARAGRLQIESRSAFNGVLYLRRACGDKRSELACRRFGDHGFARDEEKLEATVAPGRYWLIVDGQNTEAFGSVELSFTHH